MLQKIFNRRNFYFATFYIYDTESGRYVGIIEHHDTDVRTPYFVGIKYPDNHFIPGAWQAGDSAMFDSYEAALDYITRE